MSDEQFTFHRKSEHGDEITTGLSRKQLLRLVSVETRSLPDDVVILIELRTERNDPMQWGP